MAALQQQKVMGKAPLQSKVATLLLHLLDQQQAGENNQMIAIPLTRKEIADSVGASVESVIRVMSEWSKKGFILTNNQKITLVKPEKLIELINI